MLTSGRASRFRGSLGLIRVHGTGTKIGSLVETPTLRELLFDGSFYASVALVAAAMAVVIGLVYVVVRRRRRNRRRRYLHYYGPRHR
jgi:hypothetical protein